MEPAIARFETSVRPLPALGAKALSAWSTVRERGKAVKVGVLGVQNAHHLLRITGQFRGQHRGHAGQGSWINLVWFAEIDDDKSIKQFVEEALRQVDWQRQVEGYSS